MSSSISVNGQKVYRPGMPGRINADGLNQSSTARGNLAVVLDNGKFPYATPVTFTSARALTAWDPSSSELRTLADLVFNPAPAEAGISGASSVTMCATGASTQASYSVVDKNGDPALVVTSRVWGPTGNRTLLSLSLDTGVYTANVLRDGITETLTSLVTPAISVEYTGAFLTSASIEATPTDLHYTWAVDVGDKLAGIPLTPGWTSADTPLNSTVTSAITDSGGPANLQDVVVTVVGTAPDGSALTDTITKAVGGAALNSTAAVFASIISITIDTTDPLWVGNTILTALVGKKITYNTRTVASVIQELGQVGSLTVAAKMPQTGIQAKELDATDGAQDVKGVAYVLSADMYFLSSEFLGSGLVTTVRGANGLPVDLGAPVSQTLVGGSSVAATTPGWQAALDALKTQNVQCVVPMSTDIAIHQKMTKHCTDSALQGFERSSRIGIPKNKTLALAFTDYVLLLSDQHITIHVQGITRTNPTTGLPQDLGCEYTALMLAAMQMGTPVATPMTRKRPGVLGTTEVFDPELDANEAIQRGLSIINVGNKGFYKLERDVTSYLATDNPAYSETSTYESFQTSIRETRAYLEAVIGTVGMSTTRGRLLSELITSLNQQTNPDHPSYCLKAYANPDVVDMGDSYPIYYDAAGLEPVNFAPINLTVVRIPGA